MPDEIQQIPIPRIDTAPRAWRPCNYPCAEGWRDYVGSLREHGLQTPILCRRVGDLYEPITGIRAVLAAAEAGLEAIPAIIFECDDADAAIKAFQARAADEVGRGVVLERAWALDELSRKLAHDGTAVSGKELVSRTGMAKAYVSECRRIGLAFPRDAVFAAAADAGVEPREAVALPKVVLLRLSRTEAPIAALREHFENVPQRGATQAGAHGSTVAITRSTGTSANGREVRVQILASNLTPEMAHAVMRQLQERPLRAALPRFRVTQALRVFAHWIRAALRAVTKVADLAPRE